MNVWMTLVLWATVEVMVGTYNEHFTMTSEGQKWDCWSVFTQSRPRRALSVALEALTDATHGLEWALDPLAARLHALKCHDDCHTGQVSHIKAYWRTPQGMAEREQMHEVSTPQTHPGMWDTSIRTYCARLPLCADIDFRVYAFSAKGRRQLGQWRAPARPVG